MNVFTYTQKNISYYLCICVSFSISTHIYSRFLEISANFVYLFWYYLLHQTLNVFKRIKPPFSPKKSGKPHPQQTMSNMSMSVPARCVFKTMLELAAASSKKKINKLDFQLEIISSLHSLKLTVRSENRPSQWKFHLPTTNFQGAMLVYQRVVPFALCSQHIPLMFFPQKSNKQTL